ncbi:MAG: hypothetical protein LBI17_01180 [Rickettsiales bacterium]|jgi:hypothetical protein|nr:hypothetical protein [Rickettsiales bacterium]
MKLRNTILLIITAIAATGSVNAAKQCMPCEPGKWGEDGKCEQDCEAGYYCNGGSKIKCDTDKGECCPTGSTHPRSCYVAILPAGWTQEWTCSTDSNLLPRTFPANTISPGTYSYCNCRATRNGIPSSWVYVARFYDSNPTDWYHDCQQACPGLCTSERSKWTATSMWWPAI